MAVAPLERHNDAIAHTDTRRRVQNCGSSAASPWWGWRLRRFASTTFREDLPSDLPPNLRQESKREFPNVVHCSPRVVPVRPGLCMGFF